MREMRLPSDESIRRAPRERRVLAVSGDTQVGLWMVRSLGRAGLTVFAVCASRNGLAAYSRFASGVWTLESGPGSPGFADQVLELARRLDVGSVMAIAEGYHVELIANRHRFEPDIHVFSPPADCFEKATDKDYMHALCLQLGVPVAKGTTLDLLMSEGNRQGLEFPLVLRARRQVGAGVKAEIPWKAAYASNDDELRSLYERVKDGADNVLVQEYHPGVEDHVQILMHNGEPFMVGDYMGEDHMPLAGGVTVMRVSCRHEELTRDAVRLLQALKWEGIAGAQFHYDPQTGKYIFLEINPRFIGGLPTVIMAGFDAPLLLWQSHFEPQNMRRGTYQLGMRTRILGGDANWMLSMIRRDPLPPGYQHISRPAAVGNFLWNSGPWTRDDTFCLGDLLPTWADLRNMVAHLGQRSHDIIGQSRAQGDAP